MTNNVRKKNWGEYVTSISIKTSILINLFYFKIPAGYKNSTDNTGRQ